MPALVLSSAVLGGPSNRDCRADGGHERAQFVVDVGRIVDGGSDGNDVLIAGSDKGILLGGAGNDFLEGDKGLDLLIGGLGADPLKGGSDGDILAGGSTTDDLDAIRGQQLCQIARHSYSKA